MQVTVPAAGAPPTSVFVTTLLKKYSNMSTKPFSTVVESWRAVDDSVMSFVDLRERQALNHASHLDWVSRSPKYTIAHWAAGHGFLDVLKGVMAQNSAQLVAADNTHNRPVHWAAKGGHVAALEMLLAFEQERTSVDADNAPLTVGGECGNHIAMLAAQHNHAHVLQWLQDQGGWLADMLTLPEKGSGSTALHVAAQSGATEVLQFFFEEASSYPIDCVDRLGRTIAHYAAESGRQAPLTLLHGNSKWRKVLASLDERGASAMHYASRNPRDAVVPFLHASCGLDLALLDCSGNAPAVWTIAAGRTGRHIGCLDYMAAQGVRLGALVCADGRSLLRLVRDTYGTQCKMFAHLQAMGLPE